MPSTNHIASHLLRSRLSSVCAAITGATADEVCTRAAEALQETTFLEFRLDYLPDPASALPAVRQFLSDHNAATLIATCRPKSFGGRFAGTPQQAFEILVHAAEAGFHLVDLDLEAAELLGPASLDRLRQAGAGVILSHHDFHGIGDPAAIYARMESFAPDFTKIAATALSLTDNLTMLRFLRDTEDRARSSLVGICMGEKGILSRILGPRSGSAFTFASAAPGEETAPGQIDARSLLDLYRVGQLDQATKVFGVAGDPVSSSLSPLMLNTAFRRETVNAVYVALSTHDAKELLALARDIPIAGLSITMPLKRDILPLLERTDPLSSKIGAVNTVRRTQDGKLHGFNTDVAGIVGPLERRLPLRGAKVLVLGAGGAARAAVFGCVEKGADVAILNRTPATATKLAREAGAKVIQRQNVAKAAFDVVINATPAGMSGQAAESLLQPDDLTAPIVFDLVYNPLETPLLRLARQKGLTPISGVEMFVTQGARQFEIWTGKPAPLEEMTNVVLHALRQRDTMLPSTSQAEPVSHPAKDTPAATLKSSAPARSAKALPPASKPKASKVESPSASSSESTPAAAPKRKAAAVAAPPQSRAQSTSQNKSQSKPQTKAGSSKSAPKPAPKPAAKGKPEARRAR